MKSLSLRAWLAAITLFLCGGAAGVATTIFVGGRLLRTAIDAPPGARGAIDKLVERLAEDATRRLKLTPEESARVSAELNQTAVRVKALRVDSLRRLRDEFADSRARVIATLPPEKQAAARKLFDARMRRFSVESAK